MNKIKYYPIELSKHQKEQILDLFPSVFNEKDIDKDNFNIIFENNRPPDILYHYTSLDTFRKILRRIEDEEKRHSKRGLCKSFVLRGSHIEYLNEVTEFKQAAKLMAELVQEYENTLNNNENKNIASKLNEHYWEGIVTFHGIRTPPFITSFSEDDNNLPMWNTYGHNGMGIAIGIEKLELNNLTYESNTGYPCWVKCIYQDKLLKDNFLQLIKKHIYNMFSLRNDSLIIKGIPDFDGLAKYFSILKNFAYEYEREWRLVKSYSCMDSNKEIKFHESNGLLKPYVEHKFPKTILKEVILGPCLDRGISKKSLIMSLERAGFSTTKLNENQENFVLVKCSEIPYRHI